MLARQIFLRRVGRTFCGALFGFVLFTALWHLFAVMLASPALPEPLTVYLAYREALQGGITAHAAASFLRVCIGLGISLVLALATGTFMGLNSHGNRFLGPLLYFTYPLPKLALLPVVMLVFGIGEASKIIIIVLILVFPLTLSIRDAIRSIPVENYALLISLKASRWESLRHVTLPAVLPEVISSLRVSVGIALSALFFTESYGTDKGLGFYIIDCWMRLDYVQMYFGLTALAFSGFSLFFLFDAIERLFCRWSRLRRAA